MMEFISPEQLKSLFAEEVKELERKLGAIAIQKLMSSEDGRSFIRQTAADQASVRAIQMMGLHEENEAALVRDIILRFAAV